MLSSSLLGFPDLSRISTNRAPWRSIDWCNFVCVPYSKHLSLAKVTLMILMNVLFCNTNGQWPSFNSGDWWVCVNARLCNKRSMGPHAHLSNNDYKWAFKGYCAIWPLRRITKHKYPSLTHIVAYMYTKSVTYLPLWNTIFIKKGDLKQNI